MLVQARVTGCPGSGQDLAPPSGCVPRPGASRLEHPSPRSERPAAATCSCVLVPGVSRPGTPQTARLAPPSNPSPAARLLFHHPHAPRRLDAWIPAQGRPAAAGPWHERGRWFGTAGRGATPPRGRVSSEACGRRAAAGCRRSASPPASGGRSGLVCRRQRRRAPSRAPHAAWQPAIAPGVRSFLTTSQVPELIWELFISCQKTALPAKKTTLAAERPRAWYEGSPGLNHKAPAVWLESKAGRAQGGGARGPMPYGST